MFVDLFLSLKVNCYKRIPSVNMSYVGCMSDMAVVFRHDIL